MKTAAMVFTATVAWFIISSATAYGNVVFLHRETNASVEIPCECSDRSVSLFAFALKRGPHKSKEVLYLHVSNVSSIEDAEPQRISVQNHLSNYEARVNIKHLQNNDTDLYWCVFYYETDMQLNKPGSTEFFIYVEAPELCRCSNLLLYALSAAAALLFFCLLTLTRAYCKKPVVQPVYEDMRSVRFSN